MSTTTGLTVHPGKQADSWEESLRYQREKVGRLPVSLRPEAEMHLAHAEEQFAEEDAAAPLSPEEVDEHCLWLDRAMPRTLDEMCDSLPGDTDSIRQYVRTLTAEVAAIKGAPSLNPPFDECGCHLASAHVNRGANEAERENYRELNRAAHDFLLGIEGPRPLMTLAEFLTSYSEDRFGGERLETLFAQHRWRDQVGAQALAEILTFLVKT